MISEIRTARVDLFYIAAGCLVFVVGMNGVMMSHQLLSGGLAGIALLLHHLLPGLDTGWWYLLLNLPMVWLGWRYFGRRFMVLTVFGMVFFAITAVWIKPTVVIHDRLTATFLAGMVCGLGGGLVLRSRGSAGGFDVLAIYFNRKLGLSVANVGLALNMVPLAAGLLLHDLEIVLYSSLFYYVYSRVMKVVMRGMVSHKRILAVADPLKMKKLYNNNFLRVWFGVSKKCFPEAKKGLHFYTACIKSAQFFSFKRPL
ncbi:MAG: YitT family protein [Desulfobacteraceae bacterium]